MAADDDYRDIVFVADDFNQIQRLDIGEIEVQDTKGINIRFQQIQGGVPVQGLIDGEIALFEMSSIELKPEGIILRPEFILEQPQASLEFINPLAAERNIKIEFENGRQECWQVLADATRLKQVFINILANAVKYNNMGGAIMIRYIKMPNQRIRVAIKDTGTGISPSNLSNIFEPFDRAGRENSSIEGTGLGLALSKKIVETMNGAIGVESVLDIGSEFWVEFDDYTS
ncbi:MAG: ATP-binding protein [Rhodospirillales bacterium]